MAHSFGHHINKEFRPKQKLAFSGNFHPQQNPSLLERRLNRATYLNDYVTELTKVHSNLRELDMDTLTIYTDLNDQTALIEMACRYQDIHNMPKAKQIYERAAQVGPIGQYWYGIFLLNEIVPTQKPPWHQQLLEALFGIPPGPKPAEKQAYQLFYQAALNPQNIMETLDAAFQVKEMRTKLSPRLIRKLEAKINTHL